MRPFGQPNIIIVIILVHNSGPGGYHFIYFLFFLKIFIKFVTILLLFYVLVFWL